ncbi:MAG: glycosyltransferase [Ilumatobacteraceae bacterium]|nr:glycosyltransferase [Ilumatobacteraceae bacterium]
MSSLPMSLSVVVPCFDEERRIGTSLVQLCDVLTQMAYGDWEVLIVDDHSSDDTRRIVEAFAAAHPRVHLEVASGGKGKGAAVRTGVMLARYDAVLVVDADLAGDLGVVPQMCRRLATADAVIGSRLLPGAIVEPRRSVGRRGAALIFRTAVRLMTPLRVSDPQCGFKLFRREVVQAQIAATQTSGYAYEIELLLRLTNAGAVIEEVPVTWREGRDSKVRVVRDGIGMLAEVWSARRRAGQAG